MGANIEDHGPSKSELTVTCLIDAPPALVFEAWKTPEHAVHWWGPRGFRLASCELDFRPGGRFRCCLRSPEDEDHWLQGVYREIIEPERLVFTFAWEDVAGTLGMQTLVTVTLAERGDRTKLTLKQAGFVTAGEANAHEAGWIECLQRLVDYGPRLRGPSTPRDRSAPRISR